MSAGLVLVHSPLVGASCWSLVAEELRAQGQDVQVPSCLGFSDGPPPYWEQCLQRFAESIETQAEPFIFIGHSGAGALLPQLSQMVDGDTAGFIFVDAGVPPHSGEAATSDPEFFQFLAERSQDGKLPPWAAWWEPQVMERLIPDARLREQATSEMPPLPLHYFEEAFPVPAQWEARPCAYLQFSDNYQAHADEARGRGYTVDRVPGRHLHMLVQPDEVGAALLRLAERLHA